MLVITGEIVEITQHRPSSSIASELEPGGGAPGPMVRIRVIAPPYGHNFYVPADRAHGLMLGARVEVTMRTITRPDVSP